MRLRAYLSIAILLLAPTGVVWAAIVDGTAALVGKNLITVQDAYLYRAIQRFREGTNHLFEPETGDALRLTVQRIALEEMLSAEMKGFKLEGGGKPEAQKLIKQQRSKGREREAAWKELLKHFSVSETQVVDRLGKIIDAERFLQKRVETLTPIITETEAEQYYRQNPDRFTGEFASLRTEIMQQLRRERMQRGLEEWVRLLKEKYGMINHLGGGS